ncbi:hypothetical protein STSP2_01060 [Anaerohalosphaera lusitana]|uniref:Uncharacterized protein n=1 Tax=Anaerohalosphaera lusitana TaxID=1936003 RepID=A0A1U9NJJ1_9BACT|nr:hypothetical protein [Anaerohalosphaera lusitana]AQT67908.1 hypothetical protein STSP2_01060 [Anaerohalosphaera lusitana]
MGFRDQEKQRYAQLKSSLFSEAAQPEGVYRNIPRTFCLPEECSSENLHMSIRKDALDYFRRRNIPWHDGFADTEGKQKALPSNHLCCSQSMCVNSLFPMTRDKRLFERVFRVFFPELKEALTFEADQEDGENAVPYLCFEFVGEKTHFEGERSWPQRGANCTSLDFAFLFEQFDGKRHLVLGEWKYTEEYLRCKLPTAGDYNKTRLATYKEDFHKSQLNHGKLPNYTDYFVEPFYQLMRQSLLASKMQAAGELGADIVTHLHVSPKANRQLAYTFTSPEFAAHGATVFDAWKKLVGPDTFCNIHSENLLTAIEQCCSNDWSHWLLKRYGWWR